MRRIPNAGASTTAPEMREAFGVRRIPPLFGGSELTDSFNRTPPKKACMEA
jgi:hypothetical protein